MKATVIIFIIVALLVYHVKSICHEHCQYCDDNVCQECRHNMYLQDGTCVGECPITRVAKRRHWVFDYGRMIGNECELPLNSENKFMVAWGETSRGGSNAPVISNAKTIFSCDRSFAALTNENSVVAWGEPAYGGTVPSAIASLKNIKTIFSTRSGAFAALTNENSVVAWGYGYTPVTRMVFQYFNCHPIHSKSFIKADYSIECWVGSYNSFLVYVIVIGGLFTIGFPLSISLYIRKHRKELYTPKIQSRIGFLYGSFMKNAEFWEVHEIIRKTLLTGVIIYLQSRPTMQSSVAIMVCVIAIATLNYFEPHKNRVVFWLAQLSFVITCLKFLSTVILLAAKEDEVASIGMLLIGLDVLFFLGSLVGSGIAIYLVWAKIKSIDKTKITPVTPPTSKAEKAWRVEE